jgi:hypothetical protein
VHNPPAVSRSIVPPGGFIYDQPLADGSTQRITGASGDNVLELVLKFRQNCGMLLKSGSIPTPDAVWLDYNQQVCTKYPWICSAARSQPQATAALAGPNDFVPLLLRIQAWEDTLRSGAIDFVDIATANARAMVCIGCPMNVPFETNCGSCNQKVAQTSAGLRGARRLGIDQMLRGCRPFGTLNELSVWIQSPGGDQKYTPWPNCWRLK